MVTIQTTLNHVKVKSIYSGNEASLTIIFQTVCNCSIDGSLPNICDNTTGTCLCNDDNATPDCSECIAGFYGNIALNETCAKCPCPSASNSHALSCSVTDGNVTCVCDDQYTGTNCDECRDGYFGDPLVILKSDLVGFNL